MNYDPFASIIEIYLDLTRAVESKKRLPSKLFVPLVSKFSLRKLPVSKCPFQNSLASKVILHRLTDVR